MFVVEIGYVHIKIRGNSSPLVTVLKVITLLRLIFSVSLSSTSSTIFYVTLLYPTFFHLRLRGQHYFIRTRLPVISCLYTASVQHPERLVSDISTLCGLHCSRQAAKRISPASIPVLLSGAGAYTATPGSSPHTQKENSRVE